MPTIKQSLLGLVLAAGIVSPGQVLTDRAPSPEERSRIETMLRGEGFARWGKIGFIRTRSRLSGASRMTTEAA
jgi:hypothetical protein